MTSRRLGVLISGRGSNLQAIIDAIQGGQLDATIAVVVSNVPGEQGLARAREAGIDAVVLPHRDYPSRADYDRALVETLFEPHEPYDRHPGFDFGSRAVDRYDGEVAYVDQQVGRLLDVVQKEMPETFVAVTADHGEELASTVPTTTATTSTTRRSVSRSCWAARASSRATSKARRR